MKKMVAGLVVGLAVAGTATFALAQSGDGQGPWGGPRGLGHHRGATKAQLLEKYDANKNGVLDPEERDAIKADRQQVRAERHQKMLDRFDANHDGQIDPAERQAMRQQSQARRQEMLGKYDADGDGKLSPAEREAMRNDLRAQREQNQR